MDKEKKTLAAVGVLGGLAAVLLLRKKAEAAPQMDAAITIRVLDSAGNEVPHNSPVTLEPGGSYTIEATVTNKSWHAGSYVDATFTTAIEATANGMTLIEKTSRSDTYGPGATNILTWPLIIAQDTPEATGSIIVSVFSLAEWKLAEVSQTINILRPVTVAVDGMGDLNDDGYVTEEDQVILQAYMSNHWKILAGTMPLSDITPAAIPLWEFIRRADLNCDGVIDSADKLIQRNVADYGNHMIPAPVYAPRESAIINNLGDLDGDGYVTSTDLFLLVQIMVGGPLSLLSPLSEAECLRRADMNGDGDIDSGDIQAMKIFFYSGELPVHYRADLDMNVS